MSSNPARLLYRWIFDIRQITEGVRTDIEETTAGIDGRGNEETVVFPFANHVWAHTSSISIPSQLNRLANAIASPKHPQFPSLLCSSPYLFHGLLHSLSPSRWLYWTKTFHLHWPMTRQLSSLTTTYITSTYPPTSPLQYSPTPDYLYICAISSYSAIIQLYIHTSQLDTALTRHNWLSDGSQPWCWFSCPVFEDPHHIFIHCPCFASLHAHSMQDLKDLTFTTLDTFSVTPAYHQLIISIVQGLFADTSVWPLRQSLFYHGILPLVPGPYTITSITSIITSIVSF